MKAETAAFLEKARRFLLKAESMLANDWPDEAGRAAYLAGFHAAQAWIFEMEGRWPKTHRGVHAAFARLAKDDARLDEEQRRFLGRTYSLKAAADYETGAASEVSTADAAAAAEAGRRLVAQISDLIADQASEPPK